MAYSREWEKTSKALTHYIESEVVHILNRQLWKKGMIARRVSADAHSAWDIGIYLYNWEFLIEGPEICRVAIERKPNDEYEPYVKHLPKRWKRGASFTYRKVMKTHVNLERDLYCLVDNKMRYPAVIWAPFRVIRNGKKDARGSDPKEWFFTLWEKDVFFGWKMLVQWADYLKNKEIAENKEWEKKGRRVSPSVVERNGLVFGQMPPKPEIEEELVF